MLAVNTFKHIKAGMGSNKVTHTSVSPPPPPPNGFACQPLYATWNSSMASGATSPYSGRDSPQITHTFSASLVFTLKNIFVATRTPPTLPTHLCHHIRLCSPSQQHTSHPVVINKKKAGLSQPPYPSSDGTECNTARAVLQKNSYVTCKIINSE